MDREQLSSDVRKVVSKWRGKRGTLIMVLHEIEKLYGYVPREVSLEISREMDIPLARIYEVITFYHYFKLTPPGKHTISVCMGTACYLKGAPNLLGEIRNILGIGPGETTPDGLFNLTVVRCLGCCGLAPVLKIDDTIHGEVKVGEVIEILSAYTKELTE
ncbi:MAG TPA: NAD(P)H-dependent oxidoreductase subunit E [bacterium]|nr:NAD(P)H-dependent oxidoreductase subunit E [bacterium]HPJ72194.1 NAD(P)H-dependent oxidoreductase subunit E [bacterium]HPQ65522.1 NAD(P)H-dependent oxidoreductase subunit E [bacterium]